MDEGVTRLTATPGTLAEIRGEMRASRARSMTAEDVDAARRADPDALPPMTDAEIEAARAAVPDVRAIRAGTGLTREAFAARFGLRLNAVRDWEQGLRTPDPAARTLLKVIAREPDAVIRALAG